MFYNHLTFYLNEHRLLELFEPSFKTSYSTELAQLNIFKDILLDTDSGHCVVLMLMDLASFDIVDHQIVLSHLENWVSIQGSDLQWFRSYLTERSFCVHVRAVESLVAHLTCGVRQGSILGLSFFFFLFLGSSLQKHGVTFHFYADDIQI